MVMNVHSLPVEVELSVLGVCYGSILLSGITVLNIFSTINTCKGVNLKNLLFRHFSTNFI